VLVDRTVGDQEPVEGEDRQHEPGPDTVGTGSALAVGCIMAVVLFVLLAIVVRWITGGW
jgi:hypothetical protein